MSIHLANTIKEKEVIELLDSDDESVANLLEVCDVDFSDDESLTYENEEFMSKGLLIAGEETAQPPKAHM